VLAVMRAHDRAAWGGSDWTHVDLEECWDELDAAGDAWVAELDGRIVGAVLCDWKRNGDWGGVQTLGVRPAWRRRGMGEALLRAAFAELFRRGERTVALQVDAQSPTGANRLYQRAGLRALYEIVVSQKELRAG
jgi:mycothiol synthase